MFQNYRYFLITAMATIATTTLHSAVDSITGDTGSAQSGALTLSGGTTGIVFDGTSSTITANLDVLVLPIASSTVGYIVMGEEPAMHKFPSGNDNFFVGSFAGNFTMTSAALNAGCGYSALNGLTTGNNNTAVGHTALISVTEGSQNTAVGQSAGSNLVTGNGNILIGKSAGGSYTSSESGNIIIGSNNGIAQEELTIRIGDGQTQQHCYVDGIYGSLVEMESALPVYADQYGKLGTETSILSIVAPGTCVNVSESSKLIIKLSPLAYIFRNDNKIFTLNPIEVARVLPELVVQKDGKPFAVKYRELQVLMLSEQQKQDARIDKLENIIQKLTDRISTLEKNILSILRKRK